MSPERWRRIEQIYHSALEWDTGQRAAFLDEACGHDNELRREVESLLRHGDSQEALVDRPAWEAAGELLDTHTIDQTRDLAGHRISHYKILAKLGEGGMGAVYKARDTRLGRLVAIKFVNAEFTRRFEREARAIAALNHSHICTLHDVGEHEGAPYLVMEYIEGKPLKGPLPVVEALRYSIQVCEALAEAHQAGIVHRDLKPDNILLTREGSVKVLDFGLAKLQPSLAADTPTVDTVTERGAVTGTGPYMSPEQAQGEPVDARSDIFSFGAVLYELLSGRRAFRGETMGAALAAVIASEPPPLREAPPALARIVGKMLAKKRESRYQSAQALLTDLRAAAQPGTRLGSRRRWLALASAAVVLVVVSVVTVLNLDRLKARFAAESSPVRSLAVLPLENLSGDPEQEYFADGMTEALITRLAQVSSLRVISRTSVMRYKGTRKALPEIARELAVDGVVEGTVQRSGDRVRITAQLIRAATDLHLWSGSFERELRNVLSLQADIAEAVTGGVKAALSPEEHARLNRARQVVPEAYMAYLKAWYLFNRGQYAQAASYFEQATEADPSFALAYAMLYEAEGMIASTQDRPASDRMLKALARARELDDALAEVHTDIGDLKFYWQWDWRGGETEFRRAVDIDRGSVDSALHYALCLRQLGRCEDSIAEYTRALPLDPASPRLNRDFAQALLDCHRYEEAVKQFSKAIELDPANTSAYQGLALSLARLGRDAEAAAACVKAAGLSGGSTGQAEALEDAARAGGLRGYWRKRLDQLQEEAKSTRVPPLSFASIYAHLGEKDAAIRYLEAAYQQRTPRLVLIRAGATWDPLRSDPRFQALLRKMNFPE